MRLTSKGYQVSPRKRNKKNRGLPTGWRWRGNNLYYMVPRSVRHYWDDKTEFRLGGSLAEAYKVWAIRLGTQDRGDLRTFNQLCDRFVLEHIPTLSPTSQDSYQLAVSRIRIVYGHMEVASMGQESARQFHAELVKAKTVPVAKSTIGVLKTMMSKAAEWAGPVKTNPLLGMRFESAGTRDRYIENWEMAEILSLKPDKNNSRGTDLLLPYLKLKLMTGLRRGDLLRLKLSDLKDDGIHVQPNKTKKTTGKVIVFHWNNDMREAVQAIKAIPPRRIGDAYLFVNRKGACYIKNGKAGSFNSMWGRFVDRVIAQTEVTEHFQEKDIRAKAGSDASTLEEAQELLGHSSPTTTQRHYRRKPTIINTKTLK